ncbi:MAG: tRNA (adenosine(37)-N6)-threonylcarbamoyltransferase complex dimerization subunit type 1 TsaB [Gemmatimonadota bacterium]|nr:tRNA (adenosine(37)-N6)-threonylcarbamoyltransferase complex dimerization subunit type 1 TsaB [Gemmatimonadota bacterium]
MPDYTLALEGATYAGSAALLRGRTVIAEATLSDSAMPSREGREERVLPSVAECLDEARVRVDEISRVVCGSGPGSFTSLRIAASIAKGIAVGTGCPMYAVSSLLLSVSSAPGPLEKGFYLSVLPAMRDEWFAMLVEYEDPNSITERGDVAIVAATGLARAAAADGAVLLGPGQEVDSRPHARGVPALLDRIVSAGPVPIEAWEPDYGRLAEAQVRWELAHGKALGVSA